MNAGPSACGCSCDHQRRDFLRRAAVVLPALFLPAAVAAEPEQGDRVLLSFVKFPALQEPGGAVHAKAGGHSLLVFRDKAGLLHALSDVCMHKACTVEYVAKDNLVRCPCHGSVYDVFGKVKTGPAEKSLRLFPCRAAPKGVVVMLQA